ncbi:flagellar type III secretion system protein FliR [Clostridium sp. D2Q-14]|uniref:flagellar biosynthetic protein FliR n=1 Tax=Anaeromonas gelatinilytica TaxID=2683194 RepID=UPI00193C7F8D|nr:flagellar biosynthetic protein FliR [Anaeromonas gelatinilytica]MBS4536036.1 flagellar type III secretion system protein FliR [Anaeromonas gelatinilytica]
MDIFDYIFSKYQIFLLVFIRMTGIFIITPIFSRTNIPTILKVSLSLIISIITFTTIGEQDLIIEGNIHLMILIFKELTIGLIIGFISYLFFVSLIIAGQIIDTQIGFGMANVFDPQHNTQVPITGNFYYILALLIFLTIDAHHWFLQAIVKSYSVLPIGNINLNDGILNQIIVIFSEIFNIGFKISSPVLATIFLSNVLLGILARTVPQMNVFVVGMPLKIVVGLLTIFITLPIYLIALQHIFNNMSGEIFNFLQLLTKG